jgi:hypothetical protein
MSSRCMSLLPRTTLHSDSEHVGFLILVPIFLFPSCPHASIRVLLPAQVEEN